MITIVTAVLWLLIVGIGCLASAISSFIVVRWLIRFVQTHTFNGFAVYRVLLGGGLLVWQALHG